MHSVAAAREYVRINPQPDPHPAVSHPVHRQRRPNAAAAAVRVLPAMVAAAAVQHQQQ